MKKVSKRLLLSLSLMIMTMQMYSYDFSAGGIYYKITSSTDKTVEVTYQTATQVRDGYGYRTEYVSGMTGVKTIPSQVTYNGTSYTVTAIGDYAFYRSTVTSVTLSNTIKTIGDHAFYGSSINGITFPNSVTSISNYSFGYCNNITSVEIPSTIVSTGYGAFTCCSNLTEATINCENAPDFASCSKLHSVTLGNNVKKLGSFNYCTSLKEFSTGDGVTSFSFYSFSGCSLNKLNIGKNVQSILYASYLPKDSLENITVSTSNSYYSGATNANVIVEKSTNKLILGCKNSVIPSSVRIIGESSFAGSDIESVTIPYYVTEIQNHAFSNCSNLKGVTFDSNYYLTTIGSYAFYYCTNLPIIDIPASVTSIGDYAFSGCIGLKHVVVNWSSSASIPSITQGVFSSTTYNTAKLHSNYQSSISYLQSKSYWSSFSIIDKFWEIGVGYEYMDMSSNELLYMGNSKTLAAVPMYSKLYKCSYDEVEWSSSNEAVATVDENGKITAISPGRTTIKASKLYGKPLIGTCEVTVRCANTVYAEDIRIRPSDRNAKLPIYLDNLVTMCGFEFYLKLPEGINISYEYDDEEEENVWGIERGGRLREEHTVNISKTADGRYHFLCADLLSNKNFYESEAKKGLPIIILNLNIDDNVAVGDYEVAIQDILLNHNENNIITEYTASQTLSVISIPNLFTVKVQSSNEDFGIVSISASTYDADYYDAEANDKVTLKATPKEHYRFVKWTENGNTVSTGNPYSFTLTSDRNIVGVFELHQVTVTFKVDGVTYSTGLQTCGTALTLPGEPSKTGYTFKGWEGVTSTTVVPTANVTYNAVFEINQYTVTFLDYDNTVISQKEQDWNTIITPPANPTRTGYFFKGWTPSVDSRVPLYDVSYKAEYVMAGDVTLDGKRNLTDLTTLVNLIMNNVMPEGNVFLASDVNKDNKLNLTDMTSIVNLILDNNTSQAKGMYHPVVVESAALDVKAENLTVGGAGTIYVYLNDSEDRISNLQFDLTLPYGMELSTEDVERSVCATHRGVSGNHNIAVKRLENGDIRVMLYSFDNSTFTNSDSALVEINVLMKNFILDGTYDIDLNNVVLVRNDASAIEWDSCRYSVNVSSPTGINSIYGIDSCDANIFNVNGQKINTPVHGINIVNGKKIIKNK